MKEEEQQQKVEQHIQTQNNNYGSGCVLVSGGTPVIHIHNDGSKSNIAANDDDDIHMAIANLYEATDEEGKKIFTDQGQWYAVYRVLKEYCNYPEKMTDFVNLMKKNQWAEQEPSCTYSSIRSINSSLPLLSVKVSLWQQHRSVNDKYAKQCTIAERLLKLLSII